MPEKPPTSYGILIVSLSKVVTIYGDLVNFFFYKQIHSEEHSKSTATLQHTHRSGSSSYSDAQPFALIEQTDGLDISPVSPLCQLFIHL